MLRAAAAVALALLLTPVRAQAQAAAPAQAPAPAPAHAPAGPDSAKVPAGITVVGGESASAQPAKHDTTRKSGWSDQPRIVMMRSLIFPGWGQAYNHAWYKAGAIAAGEVWLGTLIVRDQQHLDDLNAQIEQVRNDTTSTQAEEDQLVTEYNDVLAQQTTRAWFLGAVVVYALVDAYVDAHFRNFEIEFKHDPALPPGTQPADRKSGLRTGFGNVRLGLRWRF